MNEGRPSADAWRLLKQRFEELSAIPPEERSAPLAELRSDHPDLADELEELLDEHDRDDPLRLEGALLDDGLPPEDPSAAVGRVVGPYRLVELLGRGGMGQVFLAERVDGQFEQKVALKLMRTALDSPETRARFVAERQILARLEHPDIARLLDGGVTDDGAPYLVMEWVRGEPVTDHCDRTRLGIEARLELFVRVCRAVHAAHRQLVVHRDLKPSNILVDDGGRVRLLDFGIAKLLDPDQQGAAPMTRTGLYLLTPEYASPEQVSGAPITTATDVYALGVLLYRLLTGVAAQPIDDPSPAGIHRAVCERQPERPSRAAHHGDRDAAQLRASLRGGVTPTRLSKLLEGDLDTIVETAIRKEPDRRYQSPEDLAADVERHLGRLPVRARRDSFGYRARRFVARHTAPVAAAGVAVLALVTGFGAAIHGLVQAKRAEIRAVAEADESRRLAEFMVDLFDASDPTLARGEEISARSLLDRGAARIRSELDARPQLTSNMLLAIGRAYSRLGEYSAAEEILSEAISLKPPTNDPVGWAEAMRVLGELHLSSGDFEAALRTATDARDLLESTPGIAAGELANAHAFVGQILFETRRPEDAIAPLRHAIALRRTTDDLDRFQQFVDLEYLGNAVFMVSDHDEGLEILRAALDVLEEAEHDAGDLANAVTRIGLRQVNAGHLEEAEETLVRARALAERAAAGGHHQELRDIEFALATLAEARGEFDTAVACIQRALAEAEAIWGAEHPRTVMTKLRLGTALLAAGRAEDAVTALQTGRDQMRRSAGGHRAHLEAFELPLARSLAATGRREEALEIARTLAASPDSRYARSALEVIRELDGF